MNTRAVAELLGISTSTVQRWVKQLNLDMSRNELGHFIFTDEDIELLKQVKSQLQEGILLQDITVAKPKRIGLIRDNNDQKNRLVDKLKQLEVSLNQKADTVVSYQILQHRREMEEMQETIEKLVDRVEHLEEIIKKDKEIAASHMETAIEIKTPRRKKSFLKAIFGW